MYSHARIMLLAAMLFGIFVSAQAQSAPKAASASITGRVTIGDKAQPGIAVAVQTADFTPERRTVAKATTDADGRFRLTGLPAGRFNVRPIAPAFILTSETLRGEPGKTLAIADGETIDEIDFTLKRGGVITGRVTDADGRAVVAEYVNVAPVEEPGQQPRRPFFSNPFMYETDDRGVYRIYGLSAGRYRVSVGQGTNSTMIRMGSARGYYKLTYHPDATDVEKATIVEVSEGGETPNIDITMGRPSPTFAATGRIVDAENGSPVAGALYGFGTLYDDGKRVGARGGGLRSDAKGEFRIEGLAPGRYAVFAERRGEGDSYSDAAPFEVKDGDVAGLEVRLRRGGSISGVVNVEGASDKSVLAKLSQLQLSAFMPPQRDQLEAPSFSSSYIAPDGSFRLSGLRAGKARISLNSFRAPKGFSMLRVERDGVEQRDGIEIELGEHVTGVRVVLAYGTGVVRGQVKIENGELPEGGRRTVVVIQRAGSSSMMPAVEIDARGRFVIEGLAAGDYELTLNFFGALPSGMSGRRPLPKQLVTVTDGAEIEVVLSLDAKEGQ